MPVIGSFLTLSLEFKRKQGCIFRIGPLSGPQIFIVTSIFLRRFELCSPKIGCLATVYGYHMAFSKPRHTVEKKNFRTFHLLLAQHTVCVCDAVIEVYRF